MEIDPDLKYCPQCNDEYRADIVICAACRVDLISGRDRLAMEQGRKQHLESRKGDLTPADDIVTIHGAPLNDVKRLQARMKEERIGTLIVGDEKSCGKGCCPSTYYLQVRREDAHAALMIIKEDHQRNTAMHAHDTSFADAVFDAGASEALCPACGFRFSTNTTTCPDCGLCFG